MLGAIGMENQNLDAAVAAHGDSGAAAAAPSAAVLPTASAPSAPPRRSLVRRALAGARRLGSAVATPRRLVTLAALVLVIAFAIWTGSWRVYGWYHRGAASDLLKHDRYRDALGHLQAALQVWPDDPALLVHAAQAARRAGHLNLAQEYLDQCPSAAQPRETVELERALLRAARGEGDAVADYCDALAQQNDADAPLIYEAMVQGYLARLRLPEASYYLERWLELAPESPQALYMKAQLEAQSGNTHLAVDLYARTVERDPKHDDARWQLAQMQLDLGQAQEALPNLETLRPRLADNVLVRVHLARCFDLLGRQEEALAMLDDVLSQQPRLVPALIERGRLAVRARDLAKAEECLSVACRRAPGSREAHYQLMLCLIGQGKKTAAEAARRRMNQIENDSSRLRAIATGELSRRPRDAALYAEVGTLYMRLGELEQGVRWFENAVRIDPHQAQAHEALAGHYQMIGEFGRAERHRMLSGATPAGATAAGATAAKVGP